MSRRDERYMRTGEVAGLLRTTEATVRRWVQEGLLPGLKVNGRTSPLLIPREAVEALRKARV